jgi:hypothetical protein
MRKIVVVETKIERPWIKIDISQDLTVFFSCEPFKRCINLHFNLLICTCLKFGPFYFVFKLFFFFMFKSLKPMRVVRK